MNANMNTVSPRAVCITEFLTNVSLQWKTCRNHTCLCCHLMNFRGRVLTGGIVIKIISHDSF